MRTTGLRSFYPGKWASVPKLEHSTLMVNRRYNFSWMHISYFAYGSNMHPQRFARRIGGFEVLAVAALPRHSLRFHKRGRDGSGKADAFFTGLKSDQLFGVLYRIPTDAKQALDKIEQAGKEYHGRQQKVMAGGQRETAYLYMADPQYVDETLKPLDWYKRLVVEGAVHHGLPEAYVELIEQVQASTSIALPVNRPINNLTEDPMQGLR